MSTLLVGYDLHAGQDYENLITALKRYPWWHDLDSTWMVKASLTPVQLRDILRPHIKADDKLLVMDVTGRAAAWYGFGAESSDWLRTNI